MQLLLLLLLLLLLAGASAPPLGLLFDFLLPPVLAELDIEPELEVWRPSSAAPAATAAPVAGGEEMFAGDVRPDAVPAARAPLLDPLPLWLLLLLLLLLLAGVSATGASVIIPEMLRCLTPAAPAPAPGPALPAPNEAAVPARTSAASSAAAREFSTRLG